MRPIAISLFTAAGLTFGLGQAAFAADMPARGPVYKAPAALVNSNWQGFYIGGHVGGAWSDTDFSWPTADHFGVTGTAAGASDSAVFGGGQIGYNWQFAPTWLLGVEGTFSATDLKSVSARSPSLTIAGDTFNVGSKVEDVWTITGRLGWTGWYNWLIYAKGGYAAGRIEATATDFTAAGVAHSGASNTSWHGGWTLGTGVEFKFAANWIFGVEYDFIRLDDKTHSGTVFSLDGTAPGALPFYSQNVKTDINVVTARLSYLFNWPGPIAAKY
jgi:outer membrane immunogenic protein